MYIASQGQNFYLEIDLLVPVVSREPNNGHPCVS